MTSTPQSPARADRRDRCAGILLSIDGGDPDAGRVDAVLRHQLPRRTGPMTLVIVTDAATSDPDIGPIRPARPGWSRGLDAVVDLRNTTIADLAVLYDEQIDDVARDVRRRARAHRRLLLGDAGCPVVASPLDRQLDCESRGIDAPDTERRLELHARLDDIARTIDATTGAAEPDPSALALINDELRAVIAEERRAHAATRRELEWLRSEYRSATTTPRRSEPR